MEIQFFVALMTSAISFAGQVLSAAISKAKDFASDHVYDKRFLEGVIVDSNNKLAELLEAKTDRLEKEMKDERVRESIQDVQAHVSSLRQLLVFSSEAEMNPQLAGQLVISAISPLHVSLEKAKLCLFANGKGDLWPYCQVVGTSALIAGYAYLGQDMPLLREDLENSSREAQIRMLNSIAGMLIESQTEIPWERIPKLMSMEGINELSELYTSTVLVWKKKQEENRPTPPVTPPVTSPQKPNAKATKYLRTYSEEMLCSSCNRVVKKDARSCPYCHVVFSN